MRLTAWTLICIDSFSVLTKHPGCHGYSKRGSGQRESVERTDHTNHPLFFHSPGHHERSTCYSFSFLERLSHCSCFKNGCGGQRTPGFSVHPWTRLREELTWVTRSSFLLLPADFTSQGSLRSMKNFTHTENLGIPDLHPELTTVHKDAHTPPHPSPRLPRGRVW